MSSTNVVEGEEGDHAPQVQEAHEDDNNQPQDADDYEQVNVVTSKQKLVAELEGKKEKHLRRHYFYNQLMGVMLSSPDTEDTITSTLPPIYRSFFIENDGKKYYIWLD